MPEAWVAGIAIGYFVGSIPVGLWLGRALTGDDIRASGSGRIGATNTYRRLGLKWSVVVFALDGLKGAGPPLLVRLAFDSPTGEVLAALAAMVGHIFPLYAGFRGGRAAATGSGAILALTPTALGLGAAVGVPLLLITRIMSFSVLLGATVAALAMALFATFGPEPDAYRGFAVAAWVLLVAAHRDNVQRLLTGTERVLGRPAAPTPVPESAESGP